MKPHFILASICTSLLFLLFGCDKKQNPTENLECYRCVYDQMFQTECDSFTYETCVLRQHEQSLQMVVEIITYCEDEIVETKEDIAFIEDILAEHLNQGAICEKY